MLFRGEFAFLSNFYSSPIVGRDGRRWETAEHLFQASKTRDRDEQETVRNCNTPVQAKRAGRRVTLRDDWGKIRVEVMRSILALKFSQNPGLLQKLKRVEGVIEEENTWNDKFFGVCGGVGENWLGRLLMEIRDKET